MNRFDGTAARQLELIDDGDRPLLRPKTTRVRPTFRLLRRDVYAELERRRRRAQIAARHLLDKE
ncbi:MAG TPA: hypothetical protein VFO19_08965 [Vicinamibacterales bacterium]|nr:hypothetical protein [Vicinamibacterales bacterium]